MGGDNQKEKTGLGQSKRENRVETNQEREKGYVQTKRENSMGAN